MRYTSRAPAPALAPFVESLWYAENEAAHARERILPHPAIGLLVNLHEDELRWYDGDGHARVHRLAGASIAGTFTRHFAIDTAEQRAICGVSFRPGGAAPFLGVPADELRDQHVSLADLWGAAGARVRERLLDAPRPHGLLRVLEQILMERVRALEVDPCVQWAMDALDRGAPVGAVTDRLGLSPARFIRRFAATVGLTPKRYARLRRFDRVLSSVAAGRAIDWARVALDCGYFDQAHLIHEFRDFSGLSPTAYDARSASGRHHQVLR